MMPKGSKGKSMDHGGMGKGKGGRMRQGSSVQPVSDGMGGGNASPGQYKDGDGIIRSASTAMGGPIEGPRSAKKVNPRKTSY